MFRRNNIRSAVLLGFPIDTYTVKVSFHESFFLKMRVTFVLVSSPAYERVQKYFPISCFVLVCYELTFAKEDLVRWYIRSCISRSKLLVGMGNSLASSTAKEILVRLEVHLTLFNLKCRYFVESKPVMTRFSFTMEVRSLRDPRINLTKKKPQPGFVSQLPHLCTCLSFQLQAVLKKRELTRCPFHAVKELTFQKGGTCVGGAAKKKRNNRS